MVPRTKRKSSAEPASVVAVQWDSLLDALLKTLHLPSIDEKVIALLRRLPALQADLSADDVVAVFFEPPVTRMQVLAEMRKRHQTPGGTFAMLRYALNPHLPRDTDFMARSANIIALGQDDGANVLVFSPHTRDLFVERRNIQWRYSYPAFLVLKDQ